MKLNALFAAAVLTVSCFNSAVRGAVTFADGLGLPSIAEGSSPAAAAVKAYQEGRYPEAIKLAKALAEDGNADAIFLLAFAAETGKGATASRTDALELYKKAAAAGSKEATYRQALILLNSKDEKERQDARAILESASKDDPANAGRILGEAWLRGLLSEKPDYEKTLHWWTASADAGNTSTMMLLAQLFDGNFGFPEKADIKKSLAYYQKAAALGDANAYAPLGARLLNGDESIRNEKEGREWLDKAIASKSMEAFLALGQFEEAQKKDAKAALAAYEKGAEGGQAECMVRLAGFYLSGIEVEKSEIKGREWLTKAAEAGSPLAAIELAARIGRDEKPDIPLAYKYLLSASNTGVPQAQNELGLLYTSGKLGLTDPVAAAAWFTRAAKAGFANAQNNLATLYERGLGVPVDFNNAGQLYSLAANQGHPSATTSLARMYAQGAGVPADLPKAWALASLAVEREDEPAKALLGELTMQLNETQLKTGREELEKLKSPVKEAPPAAPAPAPANKGGKH